MPQPDNDNASTSQQLPPPPQPPTLLAQGPSAELIAQLKGVLEPCQQPDASPEAFHNLLNTSLASVLQHPGLHWWCNPDLRLTSVELLHLFSLDVENDNLKRFKDILENVLSTCIECTESYLQDRQAYFAKYVEKKIGIGTRSLRGEKHGQNWRLTFYTAFLSQLLSIDYANLMTRTL